jgi:hypothetical protein
MKKLLFFILMVNALHAQPLPDTDIFLMDCSYKNGKFDLGKPENITRRKGYENQPYFSPDGHSLYFVVYSGNADVFQYDYKEKTFSRKTNTPEDEYSPMLMPDTSRFSVVRVEKDSTQRLWSFPVIGGTPNVMFPQIKGIGYYEWIYNDGSKRVKSNQIALYILGNPNTLQLYNLSNNKADTLTSNPGRGFHQTGNTIIYSVLKQGAAAGLIQYDLTTGKKSPLKVSLPDSVEDFAVTPSGVLLAADKGRLLKYDPKIDSDWFLVKDFKGTELSNFYRIAVSPDGKRIALVSYIGKRP